MIPMAITSVVCSLVSIFNRPVKENDTFEDVRERLQREEALSARERKNDQDARELDEKREQIQEMIRIMEQVRIEEQKTKICAARKAQDDERRKKEEERVARQRIKEEESELERKMEEIKAREQNLQKMVEEANQIAKQERTATEKGLGPLRWPTREEFRHALQATQYDPTNFHFAIVGRAGSGKSSLVNTFRNLKGKDPKAAPTGTKETTLEIGRYPDPGDQPPRQWIVWFDIPGAGTQSIPHYDYFIKQGLYVFDFIILAIGDRFEEIDVHILENCARFKIPAFIVRSKADMHILNSMKEYGDYECISDHPSLYQKCRDTFIKETQQMVSEGLTKQGLPDQHAYIVSRDVLQRMYNSSLQPSGLTIMERGKKDLIHEGSLVHNLLTAAAKRRCDTSTEQTSQGEASAAAGIPTHPAHHFTRDIRKMIYLPQPTNALELYEAMAQNNPELPNMLVGRPRMFTPKLAMLSFYPLTPIPHVISVFGAKLRVQEYKEKRKMGKGKGRGGHVQATETVQIAGEGHHNIPASMKGGAHLKVETKGRGRGGQLGR